MKKFVNSIKLFLVQLSFTASYGVNSSLSFWLLTEIISNIQIKYIILRTSLLQSEERKSIVFYFLKISASFVGLLDVLDLNQADLLTFTLWLAVSSYLLAYLIFIIFAVRSTGKGRNGNKFVLRTCTQINILHSKVLFGPIYFFYLNYINWQGQCRINLDLSFYCHPSLTLLTFLFLGINVISAGMKELFFYQVYRNKNTFSVKTNLHAIIQLVHKALLLSLLVFRQQDEISSSILNFLFSLSCFMVLYFKLPLFNVKCLKAATILSTITTTLSFTCLWKVIVTANIRVFETIAIVFTPIIVKLVIQRLNTLLKRIISLKFSSPDCIVQLPVMLNYYNFRPAGLAVDRTLPYKDLYNFGFVRKNSKTDDLIDLTRIKERKNSVILRELLRCHHRNPRSSTILLCIIKFYIDKTRNVSQVMAYIQKINQLPSSIPIKCALLYVKSQIDLMLSRAYSEECSSLDFMNYFKYKELSTILKDNIQAEVVKHLEFWASFSRDKVDMYQILQTSKNLDRLASKTQKFWKENQKDLANNFPVPLVLYSVYQSLIRNVSDISQNLAPRSTVANSKLVDSMEKWFSQERAIIIASNQKGSIGKVLDASYSVRNLFNIEKEALIGKKINLLMPKMIQEKHDILIERYNDKLMHAAGHNISVYCKTIDGSFFPAIFKLRVYPYIEKGVGLIGIFNRKEKSMSTIFLDANGSIIDCSKDLLSLFNLNFYQAKNINIQDIAPDFAIVNKAFNVVYLPQNVDSITSQPNTNYEVTKVDLIKNDYYTTEDFKKSLISEASPTLPDKYSRKLLLSPEPLRHKKLDYIPTSPKEQDISILNTVQSPEIEVFSAKKIGEESNPEIPPDFVAKNKAENLCQEFKEGSTLEFYSPHIKGENKQAYFLKVEPFFFEGKFYKIVKLKKMEDSKPIQHQEARSPLKISLKNIEVSTNNFLDSRNEQQRQKSVKQYRGISSKMPEKILGSEPDISISKDPLEIIDSFNAPTDGDEKIKEDVIKRKKTGINQHQQREKDKFFGKIFANFYKTDSTSALMVIYYFVFYSAVFLMLGLAVVDSVATRASLKQIELGIKLVNSDSERLASLFQTWSCCNIMYLFLANGKLYPNNLFPPTIVRDQTKVINQVERDLTSLLAQVNSEDVVKAFYIKDIYFWDPPGDRKAAYSPLDVFTGSHLVMQNFALLTNQNLNMIKNNPDIVKFGLNNTVNDLLKSAEDELRITQQFKWDLYSDNLSLLKVLISIHSMSVTVVLLSLLVLVIWMVKAYKRLFVALSTIPNQLIQKREKDLAQFKNCLQGSVESTNFMQDLNSFFTESWQQQDKEKDQEKRFLYKDADKFTYGKLKLKVLSVFGLSFILFMFILGLFIFSNTIAAQNITTLQQIDEGSKIVETIGYRTYLLSANFLYYMLFYNQSSMLLRNESPAKQLEKNLQYLLDANNLLTSVFAGDQETIYDPDIERLLLKDICSYIDQNIVYQSICLAGTKGRSFGLIGVNLQYHDIVLQYWELFKSEPTYDNFSGMILTYLDQSKNFVVTSDRAFRFLRSRLVNMLITHIRDQEDFSNKFLGGICAACFLITLLMRLIVLRYFKTIDKLRYKLIKLIPNSMISGNKAFLFYLKKEFPRDFAKIDSLL